MLGVSSWCGGGPLEVGQAETRGLSERKRVRPGWLVGRLGSQLDYNTEGGGSVWLAYKVPNFPPLSTILEFIWEP